MKKAALIIVLVFAAGLLMSSCNKEACPAYSAQPDVEYDNQG